MYHQILVAIDHSAVSQQVFAKALSLAKANRANLIILHVLSIEEESSPAMSDYFVNHKDRCIHVNPQIMLQANKTYAREWSDFKQKGLELLRFYAQKAIAAGVSTEFTQITGHPNATICNFAQSCHADILVIGKRGHSGLKDLFLGSVSNYVIHHAPCSILLVQTPASADSSATDATEKTVYA
jgi:nucleotide-binding universal stress UspA family protein